MNNSPFKKWRNNNARLEVQTAEETADIIDIFVAEDARRQGVGEALLRQAIVDLAADGVKELFLEVRTSNAPAIALYEKLGAAQVGVRKKYYTAPVEDGLLYKLGL